MSRSYFNKMAERWDNSAAERDANKLQKIADRLRINQGGKILDVGSGTGVFLPYLAKKTGTFKSITAIDIAEEMLYESRKKFPGKDVIYIQADVGYCPFPENYFDAVICYSSFPHFKDKEACLSEMYRVLQYKGTFSICHSSNRLVINSLHEGITEVCEDVLLGEQHLLQMIEEAGFKDIVIEDGEDYYFASAQKI